MGKRTLEMSKRLDVTKTPWSALLIHIGACTESIALAGRTDISQRQYDDCPYEPWRQWLAKAVKARSADWGAIMARLPKILSGSGYGDGSGDGSGYGSVDGSGSGYG